MIVQHCVNRKLKAHSPEAPAEEEESEHNLKVEGRDSFTCKYIVLDSTRPLQITLSVYWSVITVSSLVFFLFFFSKLLLTKTNAPGSERRRDIQLCGSL